MQNSDSQVGSHQLFLCHNSRSPSKTGEQAQRLSCFPVDTHLVPAAVGHLLLDVHGQHLAAEGQALGLLNHLLVRRHGVVAHHHVTLPTANIAWC